MAFHVLYFQVQLQVLWPSTRLLKAAYCDVLDPKRNLLFNSFVLGDQFDNFFWVRIWTQMKNVLHHKLRWGIPRSFYWKQKKKKHGRSWSRVFVPCRCLIKDTWKRETPFWLKHERINQNCTNQINQTTVDGIPIRLSPVCRVLTHSLHGSQHCNLTTINSSNSDRNSDRFTIAKYLLSILFRKTFNAFAQVLRLHLPRT